MAVLLQPSVAVHVLVLDIEQLAPVTSSPVTVLVIVAPPHPSVAVGFEKLPLISVGLHPRF